MNIIEKRKKEIKEVEKEIFYWKNLDINEEIKKNLSPEMFVCLIDVDDYKKRKGMIIAREKEDNLTKAEIKLKTLKKILAEEKEFMKRLKKEFIEWSKENRAVKSVVKNPRFKDLFDNLSIHSLQNNSAQIPARVGSADDEPSGERIGSSNLCKNCGHKKVYHNLDSQGVCVYTEEAGGKILYVCKCKKFQPLTKGCGNKGALWDNDESKWFDCGSYYKGKLYLCPECKKSQGENNEK